MTRKKTRAAAPRKASWARKSQTRKSQASTGLLQAFTKAGARDTHPHLNPINSAAFAADRDVALQKAGSLLAYQRFLVDARAVKAQRKGASASFERSVLAQARQTRDDLDAFTGAALRMAQQVNQTDMWSGALARATQSLRDTGPMTVKAMWSELMQSEQNRTMFASHGVSADIAAAITDAVGKFDATAAVRNGKLSVETKVAGESQPRRVALAAAPSGPADLSQLLRRSQFDQVLSALADGQPTYVEAVPAAGIDAYQPPDLFAFGAVAARQRMTEHVRKLEDGGLATYEGNDPVSIIVGMLVIGIFLGLVGSIILELCDSDGPIQQPDWVCAAGALMVILALGILGGVALIFAIDGVAVAAIAYFALVPLLFEVVTHLDIIFPGFNPQGAPA